MGGAPADGWPCYGGREGERMGGKAKRREKQTLVTREIREKLILEYLRLF